MRSGLASAAVTAAAPCFVLLPPAAAAPADYLVHGFDAALRRAGPAARLLLPAFSAADYTDSGFEADLLRQVRALTLAGPLWLGGISLGAMAALRCAARGELALAGVCALSPWPGPRPLWQRHGSVAAVRRWAAAAEAATDESVAWRWLGRGAQRGLPVWVAYGRRDRFAPGQALLAGLRPPVQRIVLDGGHDWDTWCRLWQRFLERTLGAAGTGPRRRSQR